MGICKKTRSLRSLRSLAMTGGILFLAMGWQTVFAEYNEGMEAYRKAWAAYSTQRFEEARKWSEISVKSDPENAHSYALLGDLAYLRHDLQSSQSMWQKALQLNPQLNSIQDQIAQAEMELKLEQRLKGIEDLGLKIEDFEDLRIRLPQDLSKEQQRAIVKNLWEAMDGLEPYFQYRVKRPLTVLVYPSQTFYDQMHVPTEVLGLFDGKIRIPEVRSMKDELRNEHSEFEIQNSQFSSVLWHEYTHAVVWDLSHGQAPRWLQEGLAQEAEGTIDDLRDPQSTIYNLKSKIELPPLRAVLGISEHPGEPVLMPIGQFYQASRNLVEYLLQIYGWDRMRAFLKNIGTGQTVEEALAAVYGMDIPTLEKKWKNH